MKDLASRITRQELTRCAAIMVFAGIVSSCTSQSSVTTVAANGQSTFTANFNLTSVCPAGSSCVNPSTLQTSAATLNAVNAAVSPNTTGFFPSSTYTFNGTCDLLVASLQITATPGSGQGSPVITTATCDLAGNASFVESFTEGEGAYTVAILPQDINGNTLGTGATVTMFSKASAPAAAPAITNITLCDTLGSCGATTTTFITGVNNTGTDSVTNPTGPYKMLFQSGVTATHLIITGTFDGTHGVFPAANGFISAVTDLTSGLGQPVAGAGTFTETVAILAGQTPTFKIVQTDLAGNSSANVSINVFSNNFMVPTAAGILAGAGLPGAPITSSTGTGDSMVAFTIMPMLQIGLTSSVSAAKIFTGPAAITGQGPE